jgi:hypothetical protein
MDILPKLQRDFPDIAFTEGSDFYWSPQQQTVFYASQGDAWSLLHELSHALLGHARYQSDFELLALEVAAWDKARVLAPDYGVTIDEDHIQDCLDTYRDWLHQRSTCPRCGTKSLQTDAQHYQCFNCQTIWKVTASRFCRPYRQLTNQTKSAALPKATIFS